MGTLTKNMVILRLNRNSRITIKSHGLLLKNENMDMKNFASFSTLLLGLICSNITAAATLIQSSNAHRSTTNIYIDGNRARVEMPHYNGFLVIDVGRKTIKAVLHHQRTVYDMSEFMQEGYAPAAGRYVDTYTKTKGLGPSILGFETEEYALYANDKYCGSIYISVAAMREIGLKKFAHAFVQVNSNIDTKIANLTGSTSNQVTSNCTEAKRKAGLKLRDVGFPLKNVDQGKRMTSVITNIRKGARLPPNAFVIPANYQVIQGAAVVNHNVNHGTNRSHGMTPEMRAELLRQQQHQYNQQHNNNYNNHNQNNQHNQYNEHNRNKPSGHNSDVDNAVDLYNEYNRH
jgi:hypothetical protein